MSGELEKRAVSVLSWEDLLKEAKEWGASKKLRTMFVGHVRVLFKTADEFLQCDEVRLVKKVHGIGKRTEELLTHLREHFKDEQLEEIRQERRYADLEKRVGELEARLGQIGGVPERGCVLFRGEDLLEIASLMEQYGMEEISFARMVSILSGIGRVRGNQDKEEDKGQ